MFTVNSSKTSVTYTVDMEIGICSCDRGENGSPCAHQAAVVWHYHTKSSNFVPTLNPSLRQEIGFIALGEMVNQTMKFYSSLQKEQIC